MGKIFLSYASDDRTLAKDIQARLRQHGHDVFFDEDKLKPSDGYDKIIRKRIAKSDVMVFLCSHASLAEGRYTLTELEMAQRMWPNPEGRVLPVLVGDVTFDDLPSYLKGLSAYRYKGDPVSEVTHLAEEMVFTRRRRKRISLGFVLAIIGVLAVAALLAFQQFAGNRGGGSTEAETPREERMDQSLATIHLRADDISRRANYQTVRERPDEPAVCPGSNFNIFNDTDETLRLEIAYPNSDAFEPILPIEPGRHAVLTMEDMPGGWQDDNGVFLIDTGSDNVLHFIMASDIQCERDQQNQSAQSNPGAAANYDPEASINESIAAIEEAAETAIADSPKD